MEPYKIEHLIDVTGDDDETSQVYNYLIYKFEGGGAYVWARVYLDTIHTVSIHGPFKSPAELTPVQNSQLFNEVADYFRKRFANITTLAPSGYVTIP